MVTTNVHVLCIDTPSTLCYFAVIPSIENTINDEIRNQSDSVTFVCRTVGEPRPTIMWSFNNSVSVQQKSGKYMIMSRSLNITTTENTLTVYDITSADAGMFTCESINSVGRTSKSGILTVTSKFSFNTRLYKLLRFVKLLHIIIGYTIIVTGFWKTDQIVTKGPIVYHSIATG